MTHPDCFDAFNNSQCIDGICACELGYYPDSDAASCIRRKAFIIILYHQAVLDIIDMSLHAWSFK